MSKYLIPTETPVVFQVPNLVIEEAEAHGTFTSGEVNPIFVYCHILAQNLLGPEYDDNTIIRADMTHNPELKRLLFVLYIQKQEFIDVGVPQMPLKVAGNIQYSILANVSCVCREGSRIARHLQTLREEDLIGNTSPTKTWSVTTLQQFDTAIACLVLGMNFARIDAAGWRSDIGFQRSVLTPMLHRKFQSFVTGRGWEC